MKTAITKLLKVEFPILLSGMEYVSNGDLAAAVSLAGGLGVIGADNADPDYVRLQIHMIREITEASFGVSMNPRDPWADDIAQILSEEHVDVIITSDGSPAKYMSMWKDVGTLVIPTVTTVSMGRMMEDLGADAVIARGIECEGSSGSVGIMALLPQMADALGIPVIASGGIVDGRGVAAAMLLGAQGVVMGTRLAVTEESPASAAYKKKIIAAKDSDVEFISLGQGRFVNLLKNGLTRELLKKEKAGASGTEMEALLDGTLRMAVEEGDVIHGMLPADQAAGLIRDERNCSEIIHSIMEEVEWLMLNGPMK